MARVDPYDQNVEKYDSWFDKNHAAYRSELQAVRSLILPFERALEVGVGTGRFAAPLGVFAGIDPSQPMLRMARNRGIRAVKGVAEALPFQDSKFDLVLMVTLVFLLDDIDIAFKEAHRVLKLGGSFVIGFIDREGLVGRQYEKRKDESTFYKTPRFFTPEDMKFRFEKAEFCDLKFFQTLFSDPEAMKTAELPEPGYGQGSFVVVRGTK